MGRLGYYLWLVITDNTILSNRGPRTGGVSIWKTWTHKAGEGWAELYAFIHPTDYDFLNRKHGNCETPPLPAVKEEAGDLWRGRNAVLWDSSWSAVNVVTSSELSSGELIHCDGVPGEKGQQGSPGDLAKVAFEMMCHHKPPSSPHCESSVRHTGSQLSLQPKLLSLGQNPMLFHKWLSPEVAALWIAFWGVLKCGDKAQKILGCLSQRQPV